MSSPKLIILRGPSGSGKTTTSKELFKRAKPKTVLIEQDYYRFIFKPPGGGGPPNSKTIHKMISHNTLAALSDGYDVILEGILTVKSYGEVFKTLLKEHPEENYLFYFDISFEETIKRHKSRKTRGDFTDKDMKDWYKPRDVTGYEFEHIVAEDSSLEQTVTKIIDVTGMLK